jgi:hypothetical protein
MNPGKISFTTQGEENMMGIYCEEEGKAKMGELCHFTQEPALERSLRK